MKKDERIVLRVTPSSRHTLLEKPGVKEREKCVAELIAGRCHPRADAEYRELAGLAAELRRSVVAARSSLRSGLEAAEEAMAEIRAARARRTKAEIDKC